MEKNKEGLLEGIAERLGLSPYERLVQRAAHLTVKRLQQLYPEKKFGIQTTNIDNRDEFEFMVYWAADDKSCRDTSPSFAKVKGYKVTVGDGNEMSEIDEYFLIELRKQIPLENVVENFHKGS